MPQKRRSRTRRTRNAPPREGMPRVLSREEKRELILAHASARKPIHPRDRVALWGGVIICVIFVVGAWIAVAPSGIGRIWAAPTEEGSASEIAEAGADLKRELTDIKEGAQNSLEDGFRAAEKAIELEMERERARETLRKSFGNEKITPPKPVEDPEAVSSTVATSTAEGVES